MKKRLVKTFAVYVAFALICVYAGVFHAHIASAAPGGSDDGSVNVMADLDKAEDPAEAPGAKRVGGGYAVTGQLEEASYMSVLYDMESGLPTSEANCILADRNGYIWIGGYSGIIRYDGVSFYRLPVEEGLTSGRGMFEDGFGRIWIATNDSGVAVLDGEEKVFFRKSDGLPSDSVRTFAEDGKGNVFIGTTAGVAYVDISMNLHTIKYERLDKERVLRLVSDRNGKVYGHTGSGKVFSVSTNGISAFYTSEELGFDKVTTILEDDKEPGKLYFGTAGNYVYHGAFGDRAENMEVFDTEPASNIHWLHSACGRLWVSSTTVAGYVDEDGSFVTLKDLPMKDGLEMMTSDLQGNMWFASSRYGVMKIIASNFFDINASVGLEHEVTNTACIVGSDLYIGTDTGLRIIDYRGRLYENYITDYFKNKRIRGILKDSSGNTWFSTFTGGLGLVCLYRDGGLKSITSSEGLPGNEVRCTCERKNGDILVGVNGGVAIIHGGRVSDSFTSEQGLKNTVILTVCEDDDGVIYAGTDGDGIYMLRHGLTERIGVEEGLSSDVVMRLKKDDEHGVIWVITSSAVEYLKDGKLTRVTTFPYNNNFDVFFGADDTLWFLSSQGIYIVDAEDAINDSIDAYLHFDGSNGLTSIPISHSYSNVDKGDLYIAGQSGVSKVSLENLHDFSGTTIVGLESVTYDGEEIIPDSSGTYHLPKENGRVQIVPAILDYTVNNPTVRVYLEGMDDVGIMTTQDKLTPLEYTGLGYGDYKLHVQLLDNRTREIINEKVYSIFKTPGFFERPLTRVLLIILVLAAIGLIIWRVMSGTVIRKQYSQIQEARDEAENANAAKSRFLANMSHEIRTPINTIMGMDEMILRENADNVPLSYSSTVTGYARDIKYASESLLTLINDLLDISKIESGKMHLVEQEYDTADLLRGVASMIRGRAESKKLYFDMDIDETLPKRLYGDVGKIKQVVLNLLTNAVKYTSEGGFALRVRVEERNGASIALLISVKDTGIGVRKEDLEKLFTAYERLDEVKNSNIQGTGLGLDISRQFAQLMNGKLWCESEYGEGSEFLLVIRQKIVDETPLGVFLEDSAEASNKGYKPQFIAPDADILVVDDNPMNLSVIKGLLKPTKVFVTTAGSGEECLEKIAENDFDVVLLDHMMPGMDGIETVERIRRDHKDLPVYALTANSTSGGEEFYKSKGFDGYLTKPVDILAVEHAIMRHLPESIMSKPTDDDEVVEEETLSDDMLWIESAEGISAAEGIRNSGGASQYVFALRMFYDSIDDNASVIEKAYADGDVKLATVKVHALKSNLRIIGAASLSEKCQALENAGNNKDMAYIDSHREEVLAEYRRFKDILSPLGKGESESEGTAEISAEELEDAYSAIGDCAEQMDFDAVEMILKGLKEYKLPDDARERVGEIEKALKAFDWDRIGELLEKR